MKIVFTKTIEGIGKRGSVQTVSDGYARNFLIPNKYALPATAHAISQAQHIAKNQEEKRAQKKQSLLNRLPNIEGKTITLSMKTNDQGRMYAAVEPKVVSKAIKKACGFYVPASSLQIPSIKDVGKHPATIKFENTTVPFTIELINP